jgi:hypothetical protein
MKIMICLYQASTGKRTNITNMGILHKNFTVCNNTCHLPTSREISSTKAEEQVQ